MYPKTTSNNYDLFLNHSSLTPYYLLLSPHHILTVTSLPPLFLLKLSTLSFTERTGPRFSRHFFEQVTNCIHMFILDLSYLGCRHALSAKDLYSYQSFRCLLLSELPQRSTKINHSVLPCITSSVTPHTFSMPPHRPFITSNKEYIVCCILNLQAEVFLTCKHRGSNNSRLHSLNVTRYDITQHGRPDVMPFKFADLQGGKNEQNRLHSTICFSIADNVNISSPCSKTMHTKFDKPVSFNKGHHTASM